MWKCRRCNQLVADLTNSKVHALSISFYVDQKSLYIVQIHKARAALVFLCSFIVIATSVSTSQLIYNMWLRSVKNYDLGMRRGLLSGVL